VPGNPSSHPGREPVQLTQSVAGSSVRRRIRVTNLYATPWHAPDGTANGDLPSYLGMGRLERYYRLSADQLPRVLQRADLETGGLKFRRWEHADRVSGARLWLFRLPSGQIVAALSLDTCGELIDTIDLLEDCYYGDVLIGDRSVEEHTTRWPPSSALTAAPITGSFPSATRSSSTLTQRRMTARTWCSG